MTLIHGILPRCNTPLLEHMTPKQYAQHHQQHLLYQQTLVRARCLCCMQDRVSADPDDPEIRELRAQLDLLGPLPSRRVLSHQQEMELWNWAEQEVAAGRVSPTSLGLIRVQTPKPQLYLHTLSQNTNQTMSGGLALSV
jgi:hypothetical protein